MQTQEKKIKTIICDDNEADILALKKILGTSTEILGEVKTANECLELMEANKPDLLFLDIDMPGMNGIELAAMIMDFEEPPKFAFVTGRDDLAIQAFDYSALDYVVKPFSAERIQKTLDKASSLMTESENQSMEDAIKKIIAEQQSAANSRANDRLPVKDYKERTIRFLDPKKIVFAQRDSRKVNIHTETEVFPTYYTVDKLEERLKEHGFQKANSGLLINMDFVEHMIPNGDGSYDLMIKTHKDKTITVSRSCSKSILTSLSV